MPLYHCTSSGKVLGSRAKASDQAGSTLFPPSQSQQTERPKKQPPKSEQGSVPSLCIPVLTPSSLCKSDQEDSLPSCRWNRSGRCAKLKSPGLPATHCSLPGSCLPLCLQGRCSRGAIWQAPTWLHHSSSGSSKLPTFGMAG